MNIKLLVRQLQAYFSYIGIKHKFDDHGLFAHVDLTQRVSAFSDRCASDKAFQAMVTEIESWNGAFHTLDQHASALEQLVSLVLYDIDLSQKRLIERWKTYSSLTKKISPIDANGICHGLAMTAALSYRIKHLHHYEQALTSVSKWDGVWLDDVESIFKALHNFTLPLQEDQDEGYQPIASMMPNKQLPELQLGIAFVHHAATLKQLLHMTLKPGNIILLGGSSHSVSIHVKRNNTIVYYDPNAKSGFSVFAENEVEYLLRAIRHGFENHYANRFGMVVKVYAMHELERESYHLEDVFATLEAVCEQQGINAERMLHAIGPDGKNALLLAAEANLPECVGYLVSRGCNPNIKGIKSLNNAFHSAAAMKSAATLEALLKTELSDINSYNRSGLTPLQVAVYDNCPEVVEKLLACGAVNLGKLTGPKSGVPGKTAIQMAAMLGHAEILELLSGQYAQWIVNHAAGNSTH